MREEGSKRSGDGGIWSIIWNLKIPNAVKMFMWRVYHNLLLTKENLMKRSIFTGSFCTICGIDNESVKHFLWSCLFTMDLWGACGKKKKFRKSTIVDLIFYKLWRRCTTSAI